MKKKKKISDNEAVDYVEKFIAENGKIIECPVINKFVNGIYVREIFMQAGLLLTSRIHAEEHPYFVTMGSCEVWISGKGWELICAPHTGITKPGTRRVIRVLEDTFWATCHTMTPGESLSDIEDRIWEKHDNPLLSDELKEEIGYIKKYKPQICQD